MKIHLIVSTAVVALALQACSSPAEKAAAEAPAAPAAPAHADTSGIVLEAGGLKIGATTLAIGAPQQATLNAVTAAIGVAPTVTDSFEECGAGPMQHVAWDNGLDLLFQNNAFAGWQAKTPDLSTANGVHVGSTLAELQAAYPGVSIEQDTIGWYFTMGELGGYLDETRSFIQRIDVGVTCDAT